MGGNYIYYIILGIFSFSNYVNSPIYRYVLANFYKMFICKNILRILYFIEDKQGSFYKGEILMLNLFIVLSLDNTIYHAQKFQRRPSGLYLNFHCYKICSGLLLICGRDCPFVLQNIFFFFSELSHTLLLRLSIISMVM